MIQENLSQKTFFCHSAEEIDEACDEFRKSQKHGIRFTQSNQLYAEGKIVFINTVFYLKDEDVKEELWCNCPACNLRWKYSHYSKCKCGNEILPAGLTKQ